MRALLAALCFLAFLAGGAFAPASAHPGHGQAVHAPAVQTDIDPTLLADALPQEASVPGLPCPVHGGGPDGTCSLLHTSCCGLHGGLINAGHAGDDRHPPGGGFRGPGPETALAGASGSPLFEPPRA